MAATFDVGLKVTSRRLSLVELAARLGQEPGSGSHDKGDLRIDGSPWTVTVWRANARDAGVPLLTQCLQVLRDMPRECVELLAGEPEEVSVSLDVAAFYEGAYFNIVLPSGLIRELSSKGVDLEMTVYPAGSEDSSERREDR